MSTRYTNHGAKPVGLPAVRIGGFSTGPGVPRAVVVAPSYQNRSVASVQGVNSSQAGVPRGVYGHTSAPSTSAIANPSRPCAYCRKEHVPNSLYTVKDPNSSKTSSTCSSACQTALLNSMIARLKDSASTASPSFAAASSYSGMNSIPRGAPLPSTSYASSTAPWPGNVVSVQPKMVSSVTPMSGPPQAAPYGQPRGQAVPYGAAPPGQGQPQQATQPMGSYATPVTAAKSWPPAPAPHTFAQHTPAIQAGAPHTPFIHQQAPVHHPRVPQVAPSVVAPPRASSSSVPPQVVDLTGDHNSTPYHPIQPNYNAGAPTPPHRVLPNGHILPANRFLPPQHQHQQQQAHSQAFQHRLHQQQHQLALANQSVPPQAPRHNKRDKDHKKQRNKHDSDSEHKSSSKYKVTHERSREKHNTNRNSHSALQTSIPPATTTTTTTTPLTAKHPIARQLEVWTRRRASLPPFWQVNTVILDTNVLLDEKHPDVVFDLHLLAPDLKFIVPYVLVQELDSLKARLSGPRHSARVAISRLYDILVTGNKKEKWLRGQKSDERLPLDGTLQTTSGDDRILECTNYFHTYSPPGQRVALVTFDKNLQLKATMLGMVTGNAVQMTDFFKELSSLKIERETLRALLKDVRGGVDEIPAQPDLRLEDYTPAQEEEEEDEFKKMKAAADKAAKDAADAEATQRQAEKDAKERESRRADVLARVPQGTKTNLYDTSDESSSSDSEEERNKKKNKNKKKRKRVDDSDDEEHQDKEKEPEKKKAKLSATSKKSPEVVVLDD